MMEMKAWGMREEETFPGLFRAPAPVQFLRDYLHFMGVVLHAKGMKSSVCSASGDTTYTTSELATTSFETIMRV